MKETWYRRKPNGRYEPVAEAEKHDYITMPPQGFTLTYRKDGLTQWEYAVQPDNASFKAAAMVSRTAMEEALRNAATYKPSGPYAYTRKQLAIIKQFNIDMGTAVPLWWQETSARDVAQAGIDAVGGAV